MRIGRVALITAVAAGMAAACGVQHPRFTLPAPKSANSFTSGGGLEAGFGRADITPPPGVGVNGDGFENHQTDGWQHHLYARAMILQDERGERIAYLVADLPFGSAVLQRLTAQRIVDSTGIGADRLIVSSTHTHSGPGNFSPAELYNKESGVFSGYDSVLVDFLVRRFSAALLDAYHDLRPAVAAWDSVRVVDVTRNRSFDAVRRDTDHVIPIAPGATTGDSIRGAVDRWWRLLRVDRCDSLWHACAPRGAFSVFAIHPTGIPPATTLLDGDVHAIVERGLERAIDSMNPALGPSDPRECGTAAPDSAGAATLTCDFRARAIHLFANGTEGDVSPAVLPGSRCGEEPDTTPGTKVLRLRFRRALRPEGPRTPPTIETWRLPPGATYDDCLRIARRSVNVLGDRLVRAGVQLFHAAGTGLSKHLLIRRAFTTVDLRSPPASESLCPPLTGTSNFAGAEDARTRFHGWRILWVIPTGIEEGGSAIDHDHHGCDGAKRPGLGPFQAFFVRDFGLPRFVQFSVVRIGDVLVAATPWEITSEAGARMRRALGRTDPSVEGVAIVGLADGYSQYVTTPEEYEAQNYEGGSDLYGANTAPFIRSVLVRLARSIVRGSPVVVVDSIPADPGPYRSYFPRPTAGTSGRAVTRRVLGLACDSTSLPPTPPSTQRIWTRRFVARWIDAYPGALLPATGEVVEIQRRTADGRFAPVAWDDGDDVPGSGDDRRLAVRALGPSDGGYEWSVTWNSERIHRGDLLRIVLPARPAHGTIPAVPALPTPHDTLPAPVAFVQCR